MTKNMRKPGYNPGTRAADVIGDCISEINPETAVDDAHDAATSSSLKDRLDLPRRIASTHERRSRAIHESGHAMAALIGGAAHIELLLRQDATGQCIAHTIEDAEAGIIYSLAGAFAEIKFRPAAIHDCTHPASFDFLVARGKIDALNASRAWPQLTYRTAAKNSMRFIEAHWTQVQNLALALADAGELDDYAVRLFASCGE
jgi:hypothetical protein